MWSDWVSNGNSHPERCGLPGRFQFVVLSQDVRAEKPDPEIFQAACAKAGCTPDKLIHVGDSLDTDVRGANAIGAASFA
jgi:putative hydrolase of the HAD superfamily